MSLPVNTKVWGHFALGYGSAVRRAMTCLAVATICCAMAPSEAKAWDWFRSRNRDVTAGNESMRARAYQSALESYQRAVRTLPDDGGAHLNRGLALLALGRSDDAREAFRIATERGASREVKALGFYNLGVAFFEQAEAGLSAGGAPGPDGAPGQPDHEEAQRLFREALEAFRRSLRLMPGRRATAWNYELTLRRISEEEEAQREQEEQNPEEQNSDQENQENPDQQGQPGQDGQSGQGGSDSENQNPGEDSENQNSDNQGSNSDSQNSPRDSESSGGQDPSETGSDGEQNSAEPGQSAEAAAGERRAMDQVLDALDSQHESYEHARARARSQRGQTVREDW